MHRESFSSEKRKLFHKCRHNILHLFLSGKQSGHAKVMLWGGEDTLLLASVLVHWSLLCEQILRGQRPGIVEAEHPKVPMKATPAATNQPEPHLTLQSCI